MALVHADRVKETSTTTGTGTYNLVGAATGFRTFVAGIGTGNTCYYAATDGTDWEVGLGTVTDAAPDTLARTTILASSNAGAAVNWGAGTRTLWVNLPAGKFRAIGELVLAADLPAASDTASGAIELAVQSEMETGTDVARAVTPGRQHYHPSAAKCWVVWGTTTTIDASYNMTSITDNGAGDWTLTIATDFSSANYVAVSTSYDAPTDDLLVAPAFSTATAKAAGVIRLIQVRIIGSAGVPASMSLADPTKNHVAMFGDQ